MKLKILAEKLNGDIQGDPEVDIAGVATLENANAQQISFLANPKYKEQLAKTSAGAVILDAESAKHYPGNKIIVSDPYFGFAQTLRLFFPESEPVADIHASAFVAEDAELGENVYVGANASVMSGCVVEAGCYIGPGCVVSEGVKLGKACKLLANVTLYPGVKLGDRVVLHAGSVIGADGFGYANKDGRWLKIPQIGGVDIGNGVEIGANTTVDRGALDDTVIEEGAIIDNQVQIAHNVRIGAHTAIAGCVGIAGSTKIGKYCAIGGGVGIVGHIEIADGTVITAGSIVLGSIKQAGMYSSGVPLEENKIWRRSMVHIKNLDKYSKKIKSLEKGLEVKKGS